MKNCTDSMFQLECLGFLRWAIFFSTWCFKWVNGHETARRDYRSSVIKNKKKDDNQNFEDNLIK